MVFVKSSWMVFVIFKRNSNVFEYPEMQPNDFRNLWMFTEWYLGICKCSLMVIQTSKRHFKVFEDLELQPNGFGNL